MTIRFAYIGSADDTLAAGETVTFMSAFHMPDSVTQEMVGNKKANVNSFNTTEEEFKMNFTAYAIQAAEIANVSDAFTALFGDKLGNYWTAVDQH